MCGDEYKKKSGLRWSFAHRKYWLRLPILNFVAWLGSSVLGFPVYYRRPYTCAVCRADRVDVHCLGLKWSRQEETQCSRWYQAHVERSHAHAWSQCGWCQRFGIPGLGGGYGCFGGAPITNLPRTLQVEIYQKFHDPLEAKRLFVRLGQTDAETYRMWVALTDWVAKHYPGTWHEWWEQVEGIGAGSPREGAVGVARPKTTTKRVSQRFATRWAIGIGAEMGPHIVLSAPGILAASWFLSRRLGHLYSAHASKVTRDGETTQHYDFEPHRVREHRDVEYDRNRQYEDDCDARQPISNSSGDPCAHECCCTPGQDDNRQNPVRVPGDMLTHFVHGTGEFRRDRMNHCTEEFDGDHQHESQRYASRNTQK
jgi:hypothetical protein